MAEVARRHHIVPRFYLEGFAKDGLISTVALPGRPPFKQSTRKAETETDFYLLGDPATPGADAFEQYMSTIESSAGDAIRSAISGQWPLRQDERVGLAAFLTLQFLRGRNQRDHMTQMAGQLARMEFSLRGKDWMASEFVRRLGHSLPQEQIDRLWAQATSPDGAPISVGAVAHIEQIVNLLPKMYPYISGRPWALIRFERKTLITCDTPLVLVPARNTPDGMGVGLMTAGAILFPLSRQLGLVLADPLTVAEHTTIERVATGEHDLLLPPSAAHARSLNAAMATSARRHVYHHPDDGAAVPPELPEPSRLEIEPVAGDFIKMGEAIRARHREPQSQVPNH